LVGDGYYSRQANPPDCSANVSEYFRDVQHVSRGTISKYSDGYVPRGTNWLSVVWNVPRGTLNSHPRAIHSFGAPTSRYRRSDPGIRFVGTQLQWASAETPRESVSPSHRRILPPGAT
jgi:hypothetical protein